MVVVAAMVVDGEIQLEALGVGGVRIRVAGRRRVGWQDAGRLVTVVLRGVEGVVEAERRRRQTRRLAGTEGGPAAGKKAEEGGLGGWLVMHCANSPRRGHVTRTPGLSLIAPRRNVGHTVPTKHCTLHLTAGFPSASSGQRVAEGVAEAFHQKRPPGHPAAPRDLSRFVLPRRFSWPSPCSFFFGSTLPCCGDVFSSPTCRGRKRGERMICTFSLDARLTAFLGMSDVEGQPSIVPFWVFYAWIGGARLVGRILREWDRNR